MKNHQLVVDIEDFRAIKKAEIILDGITVVAGENGCGKSTLSKLLYYLFKTANEYEFYLIDHIKGRLNDITFLIDELFISIGIRHKPFHYGVYKTIESYHDSIRVDIENIKKRIPAFEERNLNKTESLIRRLYAILGTSELNSENSINTSILVEQMERQVNGIFESAYDQRDKRLSFLLYSILEKGFSIDSFNGSFSLHEYGDLIYRTEAKEIGRVYSVEEVVYVDTPMIIGLDTSDDNEYWRDTNNLLREKRGKGANGSLLQIQSTILSGEVFETEMSRRLTFKRNDGKEFDLLNCATGVKSFAILQLLYKNGHLNDKTLLIIDEPEVHLHPQWIVEYARLMVLLNKELGVKFFIASHNPDMVSAIKYISEKEQTDGNLNYYLAEKEENEFTYSYRHLGTEIDDIFGSFNIAIDRINLYGI